MLKTLFFKGFILRFLMFTLPVAIGILIAYARGENNCQIFCNNKKHYPGTHRCIV